MLNTRWKICDLAKSDSYDDEEIKTAQKPTDVEHQRETYVRKDHRDAGM